MSEELQAGSVKHKELKRFICENGTEEFVQDHQEVLSAGDLQGLVEAFQTIYLWEAFSSTIDYEEPLARKPNYSMEMLKKKDGATKSIGGLFLFTNHNSLKKEKPCTKV